MTVYREQTRRDAEEHAEVIFDALGCIEPGRGDAEYEAAKVALRALLSELEQADAEVVRQQGLWELQSRTIRQLQARAEQAERLADHNAAELALCGGKLYDCQVQLQQAERERETLERESVSKTSYLAEIRRADDSEQREAALVEALREIADGKRVDVRRRQVATQEALIARAALAAHEQAGT